MAVLTRATADGLPGVVTVARFAASGGVDTYLEELLDDAAFDLWVIDGEHPERLTQLLETGDTEGVKLARQAP